MNLRRIDLNLLTIFDAIMTEGSITRAAARLGMTQPALSNALTRLRRLVDDPLFIRVGNKIVPTPRAEALSLPIRQALDLAERALSGHPADATRDETRVFTLALGDTGETIALPRALEKLRREAGATPHLQLKCAPPHTIAEELGSGAVDLAWLAFPPRLRDVSVEPVIRDEFVCMVGGKESREEEMTTERYLALDHVDLVPEIASEGHGFGGWRKRRKILMEVHNYALLAMLVATAGLAATLPSRIAQHYAKSYGLAVHPLPFDAPPAIIYQAWPRGLTEDRTHIRLRRAFRVAAR
ncbi:LysR family transcriptional regulator [Parvibaculum sp.]|uniref:LysR family transcriptional regulator n=1 Tax=Parvibaculum sp. TaxID=2024848 RepID=UPI003BAAED3C